MKLGAPPHVDSAGFQRRASLLADLGTIERGKTFNAMFRELLVALIRTYGPAGAITALRNMNIVQRKLLPAAIGAPGTTAVRVRDAGHMAHFDQPDLVRSIVRNA